MQSDLEAWADAIQQTTGTDGLAQCAATAGITPDQARAVIGAFLDQVAEWLPSYEGFEHFDPYRFLYRAGFPRHVELDGDVDAETQAMADRYAGGWTLGELAEQYRTPLAEVKERLLAAGMQLKARRRPNRRPAGPDPLSWAPAPGPWG